MTVEVAAPEINDALTVMVDRECRTAGLAFENSLEEVCDILEVWVKTAVQADLARRCCHQVISTSWF